MFSSEHIFTLKSMFYIPFGMEIKYQIHLEWISSMSCVIEWILIRNNISSGNQIWLISSVNRIRVTWVKIWSNFGYTII